MPIEKNPGGKEAAAYLVESAHVLMENKAYVIVPVLLNSCAYLSGFIARDFQLLFVFGVYTALIVIIPLLYGQFIEVVTTGSSKDWGVVFRKYWIKAFVVSVILGLPVVVFSLLVSGAGLARDVLTLIIASVTLYVLPLVLMRDEVFGSISLGVKCLLGNLQYSLPLIYVLVAFSVFSWVTELVNARVDIIFVMYALSILLILISRVVDFLLFISAAAIIRDKLFHP